MSAHHAQDTPTSSPTLGVYSPVYTTVTRKRSPVPDSRGFTPGHSPGLTAGLRQGPAQGSGRHEPVSRSFLHGSARGRTPSSRGPLGPRPRTHRCPPTRCHALARRRRAPGGPPLRPRRRGPSRCSGAPCLPEALCRDGHVCADEVGGDR